MSGSNTSPNGSGSSMTIGFVLGAVVGAGVALLLAPGTGEDTRRRVSSAGRRWSRAARRGVDHVVQAADDLEQKAKAAAQGLDTPEEDPQQEAPGR